MQAKGTGNTPMEDASNSTRLMATTNWQVWLRALRAHQWSKNALLLVPLIVAHKITSLSHLSQITMAILSFCCMSSAIYLINDIVDQEHDKQHPTKRYRPLAAGLINTRTSLIAAGILLIIGINLSFFLPIHFTWILASYVVLCLAYSFYLKRLLLIDVLLLAVLYTLRILAGCAATGIIISHWLLIFSIFIFFGFALLKRIIELNLIEQEPSLPLNNRAYAVSDRPLLISMGISACYLAVLVLCLYINQPQTLAMYRNHLWLWSISLLLLFWLNRLWLLAHRKQLPDDPILFAVKDPTSYFILFLSCCFFYAAI